MISINRNRFTLLEAIASFFIVSLVLLTATILLVNAYHQADATARQIDAVTIGSMIRDDLETESYAIVSDWMNGMETTLTSFNCGDDPFSLACSIFAYEIAGIVYDAEVVVTFAAPTAASIQFKIIRFSIVVTYYRERTVILEGMMIDG
jgi:hypothetical protein